MEARTATGDLSCDERYRLACIPGATQQRDTSLSRLRDSPLSIRPRTCHEYIDRFNVDFRNAISNWTSLYIGRCYKIAPRLWDFDYYQNEILFENPEEELCTLYYFALFRDQVYIVINTEDSNNTNILDLSQFYSIVITLFTKVICKMRENYFYR